MKKLLFAFIAACLILPSLAGQALADDKKIEFAYVEWDSSVATINVMKAILEDELGYKMKLTSVAAAAMWQATASGDVDGFACAWLPATHADYYKAFGKKVVDLGASLNGAKIGWVVPTYVTIDSIEQVNANADKFDGKVIGIDPGAGLMRASEEAMKEYDLKDMKLLEGSDATMTAALGDAVKNNKWIIVTGWTPHWMFATWDLKYLKDPKSVFGGEESVHTIVREGFEKDHPEAAAFLKNFHWTAKEEAQVMVANRKQGSDLLENARAWLKEHPERVQEWLKGVKK
ncbi:glycine betaine ABC transporter substrate-binding protein [Desulfovibrio inopinatus]|uniref:glycine betaine ABC transporter substrate-binding protein n=1 Tax=Desulfovibrio inopinatus TaxID=102109 RepID=UPI000413171B|nr:glycine betaine ABC transporter substrate-binding protein [Desulfovibrio inopinatus]